MTRHELANLTPVPPLHSMERGAGGEVARGDPPHPRSPSPSNGEGARGRGRTRPPAPNLCNEPTTPNLFSGLLLRACVVALAARFGADAHAAAAKDYWAVEDEAERERLPLYQIIPAAKPEELTPANGFPKRETFLTWHRSHGDNGGTRYSALDQINRQNVTNLAVAWTYHSRDGSNNIQCNPIIVGG